MQSNGHTPHGPLYVILNYFLEPEDGGTTYMLPGTVQDELRVHESACRRCPRAWQRVQARRAWLSAPESLSEHCTPAMTTEYYDDIQTLLKQRHVPGWLVGLTSDPPFRDGCADNCCASTGATSVLPFTHIIHRDSRDVVLAAWVDKGPNDLVPMSRPVTYIHIDQSYAGAEQVLRQNVEPAEAHRLGKSRWGIINVWRPICLVQRSPLALCDARSVREEDLREMVVSLPKGKAGGLESLSRGDGFRTWNGAFDRSHAWYWYVDNSIWQIDGLKLTHRYRCSDMTPEECWLINCYDSKTDGRSRRTPHTSFEMPGQDGSMKGRENIEVRCLVFWESDSAT